jgi:hypothetical protein
VAQLAGTLTREVSRDARRIDKTLAMAHYGAVGLSLRQSLGPVIFKIGREKVEDWLLKVGWGAGWGETAGPCCAPCLLSNFYQRTGGHSWWNGHLSRV